MLGLVGSGAVALVALVVFAMAVALVKSRPTIGIVLAGITVLPLWEASRPPPLVTLSGLNIFPSDVITLILFVVGVLGFEQLRENLRGWIVPWLLFGTLIAFSLLRGAVLFGLGEATNEARNVVWFFFAMTWALAIHPDRLSLHTVGLVLGWGLVVVAAYHGVKFGIGGASSWVYLADGTRKPARFLVADQALILLCCAGVVALRPSGSEKASKWSVASSLVFMGVVVLAQNRSVWAAAGAGIVAVLIWSGQKQIRKRVFVTLLVGSWLVFVGLSSGILSMGSEFNQSVSDRQTYEWRTSGWRALISQATANGPITIAIGEPFGSGYLRRAGSNGTWTTVAPHNWYVEISLRLGIIGLTALAAMLVLAVAKSRATRPVWTLVLVAIAVFGWAYTVNWWVAPWLGAALVASLGAGRVAQETAGPSPPVNLSTRRVSARSAAGARGNIYSTKASLMRH
jgi:hypothetical protein